MKRSVILFVVFALSLTGIMAGDNEATFGVRYDRTDDADLGIGTWELLAGVTQHQQFGFAFATVYAQDEITGRTLYYRLGPAYELNLGKLIIGGSAQAYFGDPDSPDWSATGRVGVQFGETAFVKVFTDYTRAWTDGESDGGFGAAAQIGFRF